MTVMSVLHCVANIDLMCVQEVLVRIRKCRKRWFCGFKERVKFCRLYCMFLKSWNT